MTRAKPEEAAALDVVRAAARVGVSVDTIRRAYRSGRLRAYRPVGQRRIVIRVEDLEAWAFGDEQLVAPQDDVPRLRPVGGRGPSPHRAARSRSHTASQPGAWIGCLRSRGGRDDGDGRKANGKWVDRWREGGRHRPRTFDRRADRDAFRRERIRRQQLGGLVALERDVTLGEFMEDYWRLHAAPNLEPKTRELYRQQWGKHIQPHVGDYALRAITPKLVNRQLVALMRKAGVGEPTIRQALMVLQAIFTYAHAEERVPDNPIGKVTKPRQAVEREVPPVPPATVERLRARLGTRDALIVAVLAYAGLRPQELLALQWDDVVDGALRIRRKNVHGQLLSYTKTRQNRRVKLLAPLGTDLAEWALASGRRTGLVIPHADGSPWTRWDWSNWRNRVYKPHARAVGLPTPVPYDLRGSFVSLLAWEGYTLLEVARQAGHKRRGVRSPLRRYLRGRRPRPARNGRGCHPRRARTWSARSVRAVRSHDRGDQLISQRNACKTGHGANGDGTGASCL